MFGRKTYTEGEVLTVATQVKDAWKKETLSLIEKLQWYCAKHRECDDMVHFCSRTTTIPCKYRVKNPNAEKTIKAIRQI